MSALEQANAHVRRMVEANKWGKAGSTVVVAAIPGDAAVVANLGGSPLFPYQARSGQLREVTEDHTVAGVLLRAGMITPEMARYHEGRSRLEFYLGGANLVEEELREKHYLRYVDDFVVLSNDKGHLHEVKAAAKEFLAGLRLRLHENKTQVFPATQGQVLSFGKYESGIQQLEEIGRLLGDWQKRSL